MLKDMIGLIRNRGPRMVIEGVENNDQIELLRKYRVDQVQGFCIGRPGPARNFYTERKPVAVEYDVPRARLG